MSQKNERMKRQTVNSFIKKLRSELTDKQIETADYHMREIRKRLNIWIQHVHPHKLKTLTHTDILHGIMYTPEYQAFGISLLGFTDVEKKVREEFLKRAWVSTLIHTVLVLPSLMGSTVDEKEYVWDDSNIIRNTLHDLISNKVIEVPPIQTALGTHQLILAQLKHIDGVRGFKYDRFLEVHKSL